MFACLGSHTTPPPAVAKCFWHPDNMLHFQFSGYFKGVLAFLLQPLISCFCMFLYVLPSISEKG